MHEHLLTTEESIPLIKIQKQKNQWIVGNANAVAKWAHNYLNELFKLNQKGIQKQNRPTEISTSEQLASDVAEVLKNVYTN